MVMFNSIIKCASWGNGTIYGGRYTNSMIKNIKVRALRKGFSFAKAIETADLITTFEIPLI